MDLLSYIKDVQLGSPTGQISNFDHCKRIKVVLSYYSQR